MARIPYDQTSPFGSKVYLIAQRLAQAQADLHRCIDEANSISAGGTQTANLETQSPQTDAGKQFGVAVGQGLNFYNALASIKAAIYASNNRLQATIDLDQGSMIKLELHEQMVVIIGKALGAQPHDAVRAVIDELQRQINEQQQVAIQKSNGSTDHDKVMTDG